MPAVSTAGAVRLNRLLHRDATASVYTGSFGEEHVPVVVTLARQRVDGTAREVFLDWGARLTQLSAHASIAPIEAIGLTADAHPYVAIRASRSTLADELRESGPPPAGQVRALGVGLAETLATIHSYGLIHGALQPSTVLLGPARKLLVAGFDTTAPVLAHGLPAGPYTAPEHLEAARAGSVYASPAADVHNLATLLYAALGGRLPWLASQGHDPGDPLLRAVPVPDIPGVSTTLTDILATAMHTDPRQRPDAARLRDMLSNVDVSRPLAAGRRPNSVLPDLVPRSGPRPAPLPRTADIAVPPKTKTRRRRLRVNRPMKLAAALVMGFAIIAGGGLATFAVTHAETANPCPSDEVLATAIAESYDGAVITDKRCGEADAGYVAVTVTVDGKLRKSGGDDAVRLALREESGQWQLLPDCDDAIPHSLRGYLSC